MTQDTFPTVGTLSDTHEAVRTRIEDMLDQSGIRHGIIGRTSSHFVIDVYGRPGSITSVQFGRTHQINESPAHPVSSGEIPWTATETIRRAVDMHVRRLARALLRQRHSLGTEQSLGDPMWSMSVHRVVAEMILREGMQLFGHHDCTYLRKEMSTGFMVMNAVTDAGRFHPLGMRLRRAATETSCYLTATTTGHDVMTAITVPSGVLPETIMMNAVGSRLGSIIDMPAPCDDAVISSITHSDAFGLLIALEHDDVPLAAAPAGRDRPWLDTPSA